MESFINDLPASSIFSAEEIKQLVIETPTENVEYDDNIHLGEDDNIVKLLTSENAINEVTEKIKAEQKMREERDRQIAEKLVAEQKIQYETVHENKLSREQLDAVRQKRMKEINQAKLFEINAARNYETIERVERPMPRFNGNINDAHMETPRYAKINYATDDHIGYMRQIDNDYTTQTQSIAWQQNNISHTYNTQLTANKYDLATAAELGVELSDLDDFDIYWKMYGDKKYIDWCQIKSCLFD